MLKYLTRHSFVRFCSVGVIGLLSDACVLYLLRGWIGLIPAKIVSYVIAFSVTWLLNRWFTFKSNDPRRAHEWFRYAMIYTVTGCIHVLIFAGLTHYNPFFYQHPIWPLFITAVIIAFINFSLSRSFAFTTA